MKKHLAMILTLALIAVGARGLSMAQSATQSAPLEHDAQQSQPEDAAATTAEPEGGTHEQLLIINAADGETFFPPTVECKRAISQAQLRLRLMPAPDRECAELMNKVLAAEIRGEKERPRNESDLRR